MTQDYPKNRNIAAHDTIGSGIDISNGKVLPSGFALPYGGTKVTDPTQRAVLRVNQVVNNSAVYVDVPDLSFPVQYAEVYAIEVHLIYQTNTTADFKSKITLPTASAGAGYQISPAIGTGVPTATVIAFGTGNSAEGDVFSAGQLVWGHGQIYVGSNGVVTLAFAQQTANGSDTVLAFGSYIKYERVLYT